MSSVARSEHQHPAAHHPDQVGELLRFLEIVGAKQDGAAFGAKPGDQAAHVARRRGSSPESARPEDHRRLVQHRGSGRGAASFPWTRWRRGGRAHPTARAAGATARSRRESSPPRGRTGVQKLEVGPAADPVVEARRLGEQSHPRPQLGTGPVRRRQLDARDARGAARHREQAQQHPNGGGLPRPVGAEDGAELSLGNRKERSPTAVRPLKLREGFGLRSWNHSFGIRCQPSAIGWQLTEG